MTEDAPELAVDGEAVDVAVEDVEVEGDGVEEVRHAGDAAALAERVRELFGGIVLTTDVDRRDQTVAVNGENWKLEVTEDGLLRFKPGGASLRFVRRADRLESVRHEDDGVTFRFAGGEAIRLDRGLEHRA